MDQEREISQQLIGQLSYAAIDFESAGAAPGETDQPVQVGIVRVDGLFAKEEHYCQYIASERPVHWRASKVHGITSEQLKDATPMHGHWLELKRLLGGAVIVGHNLGTERKFLNAFPAHGFGPWLDSLTLARKLIPEAPDYSLGAICEALELKGEIKQLCPCKNWHDAHFDAVASLCLLRYIVRGLELDEQPLGMLDFAMKY